MSETAQKDGAVSQFCDSPPSRMRSIDSAMGRNFRILDSGAGNAHAQRPASREDYFVSHKPAELHGRLGFGGQKARLVGCEVLELSDTGALVETYAPVEDAPKYFTLEINGQYQRARLYLADGRRLRLEFVPETLDYIETS